VDEQHEVKPEHLNALATVAIKQDERLTEHDAQIALQQQLLDDLQMRLQVIESGRPRTHDA
jgi:hypothetical protein